MLKRCIGILRETINRKVRTKRWIGRGRQHDPMRRRLLCIILGGTMAALAVTGCMSEPETFPDPEKTITLVVPQAAGGGTDMQARQLVEAMKAVSGNNNMIVENVTGGSTGTGTNQVIQAEPDGYTLLMYGTYVICGTMTGYTQGHHSLDFLTGLTMEPFVLAVRSDSPYSSFRDLVKGASDQPGRITLGNAGATATTGIVAYGLNNALQAPFNVVAFNGGAELVPAVLGGHCDAGIFSQSEVLANRDGLKPLVFFGKGRSSLSELKDVPNLEEEGYAGLHVPGGCFRGICAPKGTPDEVKTYLADLLEKAFNSDMFQDFLREQGLQGEFTKLADFEKYNDALVKEMTPIVQMTGLAKGEYAP